jgi:hypothetical protein
MMVRFWCGFDMFSRHFQKPKQNPRFWPTSNHKFDTYQSRNWNHIKIITAKLIWIKTKKYYFGNPPS